MFAKRFVIIAMLLTLILVLVLSACAKPAPPAPPAPTPAPAPAPAPKPEPIVLKGITFLPKPASTLVNWNQMIELVKERSNGRLIIDYLGGPEAMPPMQQPKAVQSGVVDISVTVPGWYEQMGIMAGGVYTLSQLTIEQEREPGGVYDLLQEQHRKAGLFNLGRQILNPFLLWPKELVKTPKDLAGRKIVSMSISHYAFTKAFGGIPLTVRVPELYTAMERGLADVIFLPITGTFFDQGFYEVVKYGIDHKFFLTNANVIINLDSWNRIPKDLQDLLREIHMETLLAKAEFLRQQEIKQRKIMTEEHGLKFIKFAPYDAERYIETIYDAEWAKQLKKYPEDGPKFKKLTEER